MSAAQRRLAELVLLLDQARPGEALEVLDECLELLRAERRIEAALFCSASRALRLHGVRSEELPEFRPLRLDEGEALVLLVRDGAATTAILRALAGRPRNRALVHAPETAHDAVVAFRRALARSVDRTLIDELSLVSRFEMDLFSAEPREVEGDSLGLAAVAAAVSLCLHRPVARDIACAAGVSADGTLTTVTSLDKKLVALRAAWPEVQKIVVAASQPAPETTAFQIIRARSAVEAMTLLDLQVSSRVPKPERLTASLVALVAALLFVDRFGRQPRVVARTTATASAGSFDPTPPSRREAIPQVASQTRVSSPESERRQLAFTAPVAADAGDASGRVAKSSAVIRARRVATISTMNREAARDAGAAALATANRAPLLHP